MKIAAPDIRSVEVQKGLSAAQLQAATASQGGVFRAAKAAAMANGDRGP